VSSAVRRSRIRLARPFSPIPVAVLILLVWWVVAHNSGSGWVQVLGDAVFGMLLIGLFAPAVVVSRVRLGLIHAPSDAVTGVPLTVELHGSSRVRITPIKPGGPAGFAGPARGADQNAVALLPDRRGVYEEIVFEVASAAPFGLQWWTRRASLRLLAPLHIAPRLGRPLQLPDWVDERAGARGRALPSEAGDARGVREYRAGDRRRRVHWGASAHTGRLMVREMEEPSAQPVTMNLNLPVDEEAAERLAEQALGTIVALLDRGVGVVLATHEAGGTVVQQVTDRREAGRRLARASGANKPAGVEVLP